MNNFVEKRFRSSILLTVLFMVAGSSTGIAGGPEGNKRKMEDQTTPVPEAAEEESPLGVSSQEHSSKKSRVLSPAEQAKEEEQIKQLLDECRTLAPSLQMEPNPAIGCALSPIEEKRNKMTKQLESCNGSLGVWKFCREFGKKALTGVGFTAFSTWTAAQCAPKLLGISAEEFAKNEVSAAAQVTALTTAVGSTLNAAWQAWENCKITEFEALRDMDLALRTAEQETVKKLPEDLKQLVLRNYSELDQRYIQAKGVANPTGADELRKAIFKRELFVLMMPHGSKDISISSDSLNKSQKEEIDREIEEILTEYPANKGELRVLIAQIRANSAKGLSSKQASRVQKYLYGPPGTGKSSLVNRLAKVLGLYVCRLTATELSQHELMGSSYSTYSEEPKEVLGKLGDCYREAGVSNFIVFIDELGDTFKPSSGRSQGEDIQEGFRKSQIIENLKLLLDPDKKELQFKGLGATLDFSKVTVLGAGNYKLTDTAILRRMAELRFPRLSSVQKTVAFQNGYRAALSKLSASGGVSIENLMATKEVVDRNMNFIISKDKDFPGGGVVKQVLEEVFTHISLEIQAGKKPQEIHDEDVQKQINNFFLSRSAFLGEEE